MPARDHDQSTVLRVAVEYRHCRCGGWVMVLTPDGMPPRALTAADADEATYVVRYELDVIMSETGRDLTTDETLDGECESCAHVPVAAASRPQRAWARRTLLDRYKRHKGTRGTCPG